MIADILMKVAGMEQDFWNESYRPRPSAAGQCIRALVYKRLGMKPEPMGDRFPVIFDDGNWHEELTLEWIAKSSFTVTDRQMRVTVGQVCGRDVTGSIDGILEDAIGNQRLWEHKAINHFSFQRYEGMIEEAREQGKPATLDDDEGYMIQVQLYLCSKELTALGITEAVLLVKNKNTGRYLEFLIPRKPEIAQRAMEKLERVETLALGGEVPERPYNRALHWNCEYCRFHKLCWEGYEDEHGSIAPATAEIVAEVEVFNEARARRLEAEKEEKSAKSHLVTMLDAAKAKQAVLPDGGVVSWDSTYRKGYVVQPTTYWQLRVSGSGAAAKKGGGGRKKVKAETIDNFLNAGAE